jgi:hypothetical protein
VANQPLPPSGTTAARGGTARTMLLALRIGITVFAAVGGAVLYFGLTELGTNEILATLLGLGFALLSRQAASSLVVDALVRRARQTQARGTTNTDRRPM